MTSEQYVKLAFPDADAMYNNGGRYWGIFTSGRPRVISYHPSKVIYSEPFSTGSTRSNAWVNAAKRIKKEQPK